MHGRCKCKITKPQRRYPIFNPSQANLFGTSKTTQEFAGTPQERQHMSAKLPADRLIVGNCVEVMHGFPDKSIDLTVTSPPYDQLRDYKGYEFDPEGIASELLRVTKTGGVVVWIVGDKINGGRTMTSFRQALMFQELGWCVHDTMIYQKKNTPFMRSNAYTNCWEFMFVFSKGGPPKTFNPLKTPTVRSGEEMLTYNKRPDGINRKRKAVLKKEKTRTNIWAYAVGSGGSTKDKVAFQHPAIFPEKLAEEHILSWSNEGDIVLDPMCGSGTTCKMAMLHNRHFIGIDISSDYIDIAKQRIVASAKETGSQLSLVA